MAEEADSAFLSAALFVIVAVALSRGLLSARLNAARLPQTRRRGGGLHHKRHPDVWEEGAAFFAPVFPTFRAVSCMYAGSALRERRRT